MKLSIHPIVLGLERPPWQRDCGARKQHVTQRVRNFVSMNKGAEWSGESCSLLLQHRLLPLSHDRMFGSG